PDRNAMALFQPFLRDRAGGNAHHRLARGSAAAAAAVANAVLLPVGVVGVAGPELLRDRRVGLRALVLVAHQEADRGPRGAALQHAQEELDRVGVAPLRDVARGARFSSI